MLNNLTCLQMFVIFVTRTNGEQQRLCYARSLARRRTETVTKEELLKPVSATSVFKTNFIHLQNAYSSSKLKTLVAPYQI